MPKGNYKSKKLSDETRRKISEKAKERWQNPEFREKMVKKIKERWVSKEFRKRFIKRIRESGYKISKAHKGKKFSDEHKRKISEALKGRKLSEETRKKISEKAKKRKSVWLGRHHTKETRRKLSELHKGKRIPLEVREKISNSLIGRRLKEENPAWKGGVSSENHRIRQSARMYKWRKAVFERDNYTCRVCGQRGGKLQAHHILNFTDYPEKRFDVNNGITLCKRCHREFHKKYGVRNNTREQLEMFIIKHIEDGKQKEWACDRIIKGKTLQELERIYK